jgi:DNA-binding MarR family transcriptional regulator
MDMSRASIKAGPLAASKLAVPDTPAPIVLYRVPGYLARRFQQICATFITESLAKDGLTQLQFAAMAAIYGVPGIDQRRLAETLGIVPVNAGGIVDQLEAMGIVERRIDGSDRRARQLYLTARGLKLRQRLLPANRAANARVLEPLAPRDRVLLIDLLVRVIEGNAAHARPGAGRRKRGSASRP